MSDIFSIFKLNLLNHCLFYNNIWNILGHSYDWRLVIKIYILTFCNRTSSMSDTADQTKRHQF